MKSSAKFDWHGNVVSEKNSFLIIHKVTQLTHTPIIFLSSNLNFFPASLTWRLLIIQISRFGGLYEIRRLAVRNICIPHAIKRIRVLEIHAFCFLHCVYRVNRCLPLLFLRRYQKMWWGEKNLFRCLPFVLIKFFRWNLLSSFIRTSCFVWLVRRACEL